MSSIDPHDGLDDDTCDTPGCHNSIDDGEGWDGYCGECADIMDSEYHDDRDPEG